MAERVNVKFDSGDERITQRMVDGVRVVEKETHRVIKVEGPRYVDARANHEPRLVVIEDGGLGTRSILTKDRRSIAGLDAFIRGITSSLAITK